MVVRVGHAHAPDGDWGFDEGCLMSSACDAWKCSGFTLTPVRTHSERASVRGRAPDRVSQVNDGGRAPDGGRALDEASG